MDEIPGALALLGPHGLDLRLKGPFVLDGAGAQVLDGVDQSVEGAGRDGRHEVSLLVKEGKATNVL